MDRSRLDRARQRAADWTRILLAIVPLAIIYAIPGWHPARDWVGFALIVLQLIGIAVLPDWAGDLAERFLRWRDRN